MKSLTYNEQGDAEYVMFRQRAFDCPKACCECLEWQDVLPSAQSIPGNLKVELNKDCICLNYLLCS